MLESRPINLLIRWKKFFEAPWFCRNPRIGGNIKVDPQVGDAPAGRRVVQWSTRRVFKRRGVEKPGEWHGECAANKLRSILSLLVGF